MKLLNILESTIISLIFLSTTALSSTTEVSNHYIYAIPDAVSSTFGEKMEIGLQQQSRFWSKGDKVTFVDGKNGNILCSATFDKKSKKSQLKTLMKSGCNIPSYYTPREMHKDDIENNVNVTSVIDYLSTLNSSGENRQLLIMGSLFQYDQLTQIDFKKGFPSDAHVSHKYGFMLSPFNRVEQLNINAHVHWLYPENESHNYLNKKHEVGLKRFLALYLMSTEAEFHTLTIDPNQTIRMFENSLPTLPVMDVDYADAETVRFHDLLPIKQAPKPVTKKFKWVAADVVEDYKKYQGTIPQYEIKLKQIRSVNSLSIIEYDGDGQFDNLILVKGVDVAGVSKILGNFVPSKDNEKQKTVLTFPSINLKKLIITPVKKSNYLASGEEKFDELGGSWNIEELELKVRY